MLLREDQQPDIQDLVDVPGSDGFSFSPDPLFQVSPGKQWFIHCIYIVKSRQMIGKQFGKRSITASNFNYTTRERRDTKDAQGVGKDGRGTNLHRIELQFLPEKSSSYQNISHFPHGNNIWLWWLSIAASVLLILTVVVVVCGCKTVKNRTRTTGSEIIICGTAQYKITEQKCTVYNTIPTEDRTEV